MLSIMTSAARFITLKCFQLLFYLLIFSGRKMGMEDFLRNLFIDLNLRLKMEEFVTLYCLFIDGTKIEANANKYSFVQRKAMDKFSIKLQEQIQMPLLYG